MPGRKQQMNEMGNIFRNVRLLGVSLHLEVKMVNCKCRSLESLNGTYYGIVLFQHNLNPIPLRSSTS